MKHWMKLLISVPKKKKKKWIFDILLVEPNLFKKRFS